MLARCFQLQVATDVVDFQGRLGSEGDRQSSGITERALRWWADDEERDSSKGDGPDSSKTEELGSGTTD